MHHQRPDENVIPSQVELIVPDSHDWTTLGTGGGVETFLKTFLQYAADWGLHVTVLCPGPRGATVGSVHFLSIMPHASTELAFTRQLRRQLVRGKVKIPRGAVVLANTEHYAWAFRGMGVPIVLMSHGAIPETLRMRHTSLFVRLYRLFIERHAVGCARRIVVVNPGIKEYYLSRYRRENPGKFVEVPLGLDLQELEGRPERNPLERLSLPPSTNLVLFVGRLYPEKNLPLFIAACDALEQRGEAFQALVVGDGTQAGILQDAIARRPWLHWTPTMTHSEVLDTMAVSRVLAICSRYEAGPLVLLEAIGLGTPVVSTDVGRAREFINGYVGRIVSSDPSSFAEGIHDVLLWRTEDVRQASVQIRHRIDFRDTMNSLVEITRNIGRESDNRAEPSSSSLAQGSVR